MLPEVKLMKINQGIFEQGEGPTGYSPDYTQKFTTGYGWRKKTYYRFYKDEGTRGVER